MKLKRALLGIYLLGLCGCVSQIVPFKEFANGWLGDPVDEKKQIISRHGSYASRIGWQETTYQLDNGNWVYIEPIRPDCFVHWEVNSEGIIVGYRTEGTGCT